MRDMGIVLLNEMEFIGHGGGTAIGAGAGALSATAIWLIGRQKFIKQLNACGDDEACKQTVNANWTQYNQKMTKQGTRLAVAGGLLGARADLHRSMDNSIADTTNKPMPRPPQFKIDIIDPSTNEVITPENQEEIHNYHNQSIQHMLNPTAVPAPSVVPRNVPVEKPDLVQPNVPIDKTDRIRVM